MKIEGFFGDIKKANDTAAKLKSEGFSKAYVDSNSHYSDDMNVKTDLPGTETAPSLSGLIMRSGEPFMDRDKAPLTAASPMVSGMAGFEEIADYGIKVVVETDSEKKEKCENIITSMGGELYNPNIREPEIPDDIL